MKRACSFWPENYIDILIKSREGNFFDRPKINSPEGQAIKELANFGLGVIRKHRLTRKQTVYVLAALISGVKAEPLWKELWKTGVKNGN